ncbi:MAG: hypothetical protein VX278_23360 [Myxococcota bacterium]|nr:hypothetical protein [Myxococcota bacterium]
MFFSLLFACSEPISSNNEPSLSAMELQTCDQSGIAISDAQRAALMAAGMTQCIAPFEILIAADSDIPSSYIELVGTIVSEMVDGDKDGVVDDEAVVEKLRRGESAWLAMPLDPARWEDEQFPQLEGVLGYDIIVPMWWMEGSAPQTVPSERARAVMVEEVTHFFTQFGWSPVYPESFGVDRWDSVIARETQRAACDWWQHPENACPNNPAEYPGDCSDPSCDVVEFYHQVLVLRAGMRPAWFGIGFPQTKDELEAKLSDDIKAVMDDPQYHQRQTPLTFSYP